MNIGITHLYVLNFIVKSILSFVLTVPQCPRLYTKLLERHCGEGRDIRRRKYPLLCACATLSPKSCRFMLALIFLLAHSKALLHHS